MTAERWTQVVRRQIGLGRLLPLGGPGDGAWLAEGAAAAVLERAAAEGMPGVRLGALRLALADPAQVQEPVVPAPPSALPPGPLRLTADFAATAAEPLPAVASGLRRTLAAAATERLGLVVTEVDLRVTGLLDAPQPAAEARAPQPVPAREPTDPDEARGGGPAPAAPAGSAEAARRGGRRRAADQQQPTPRPRLP
ncbi:nucleopolyhedrovirus P10 family protein, partial [Streptomyces sp. NPDC003998]